MFNKNSKLLMFKEWLTIPDAAKHLSNFFGEKISQADVLGLGIDGHLKLSVYFSKPIIAKYGQIISYEAPGWYHEFIKDDKVSRLIKGSNYDYKRHLSYDLKELTPIKGVWDLAMIGREMLAVEYEYNKLTDGPEVKISMQDPVLVENINDPGMIYEIQECFDDYRPKAQIESTNEHVLGYDIEETEAEKLEREKKRFDNYFPASELPDDSVLVVRTKALLDFQYHITDSENDHPEINSNEQILPLIAKETEQVSAIQDNDKSAFVTKLDFKVIDSIINGNLRPFLKQFDSDKSVIKSIQEFLPIEFSDISIINKWANCDFQFDDIGTVEYDLEKNESKLTLLEPHEEFEPLIDLDIPPHPDLKSYCFKFLINFNFLVLEAQIKSFLDRAENTDQIHFFVNQNLQKSKRLAKDAHLLSKKMPNDSDDPNTYIISHLKIKLIRFMVYLHEIFEPFLEERPKTQNELRVELYNEKSNEELRFRMMWHIQRVRYSGLFKEMKEQFQDFDKGIDYLEGDLFFDEWGSSIIRNAILKGYIGFEQLNFMMAVDNIYSIDCIEPIFKRYLRHKGEQIIGFESLMGVDDLNDTISRVCFWNSFFSNYATGNFDNLETNERDKGYPDSKTFIELFKFIEKKQRLVSMRTLLKENRCRIEPTGKKGFEELIKLNQKTRDKPSYIKIDELKNLFNNLGLQLPAFLEEKVDLGIDLFSSSKKERYKEKVIVHTSINNNFDEFLLKARNEVDVLYEKMKSVLKLKKKALYDANYEDALEAFLKTEEIYDILTSEDINIEINFQANKPARDIKGGLLRNIVRRILPQVILDKKIKTDYQSLYQRSQVLK